VLRKPATTTGPIRRPSQIREGREISRASPVDNYLPRFTLWTRCAQIMGFGRKGADEEAKTLTFAMAGGVLWISKAGAGNTAFK
jgi:hypothetical protein